MLAQGFRSGGFGLGQISFQHAADFSVECGVRDDPDDLKIQANIGQCLIHLERYEEALDVYFKLEVLAPDNHRIRRPLAWCSFILRKFETAKDYLQRLLVDDPDNKYDLMNLGHVCWSMKDPGQAFPLYMKSLENWKSVKEFENSFNEDRKHLISNNIDDFDIDLMVDYLRINYQPSPPNTI